MSRRALPALICLVLGLAFAPSSHAQLLGDPDYELTPYGYRDHTGFFSHIDIGPGWVAARARYSEFGSARNRGPAPLWHVALGGSVLPRLAVHFSGFSFTTYGGRQFLRGKRQRDVDGDMTASTLGAGATYYLPSNLYFSGAAGVAFSSVIDPRGEATNLRAGLGARAAVGYEFWLGHAWGLGVAGQVQYLRARDDSPGATWHAWAFGPAFTATSN